MSGYDASTYGERIAGIYDQWHPSCESAATNTLAELAGSGRALELGIGTGRVALPLAARGVEVHGIDASERMVAGLRAKPGGAAIPVTFGDFADVPVEGLYSLVYVPFNTFFALLSQEAQVRCFLNVARRLEPEGAFAMEVFVPDLTRYDYGQSTFTSRVEPDYIVMDTSRLDPVAQRVWTQHVYLSEAGVRLYPVQIRYAWPAELDLMAQLAGMRLRERWGGWGKEPFTAKSEKHVSVYEKAEC